MIGLQSNMGAAPSSHKLRNLLITHWSESQMTSAMKRWAARLVSRTLHKKHTREGIAQVKLQWVLEQRQAHAIHACIHTHNRGSLQSWPLLRMRYWVSSSGTCIQAHACYSQLHICSTGDHKISFWLRCHQRRLVIQLVQELGSALGKRHPFVPKILKMWFQKS